MINIIDLNNTTSKLGFEGLEFNASKQTGYVGSYLNTQTAVNIENEMLIFRYIHSLFEITTGTKPLWEVGRSRLSPQAMWSRESMLCENYILDNEQDVFAYLNENADLWAFIASAHIDLNSKAEIESIRLEVYKDIDEGWEKLFIKLHHSTNDIDSILDIEDVLLESWLIPQQGILKNRIVLSHE